MGSDSKKPPGVGLLEELGWDWAKGGLLLLAPTVPTVITAASGYLRNLPLWAIITTTTVTFGACLTAIRAIVEVSYRLRIKGRLVVGSAAALVKQKPGGQIDHLGVGLHLFNQGAQTIEYKVVAASLVIDGRVNMNPTWKGHTGAVQPNTVSLFRLDMVPVPPLKPDKALEFTYDATFMYGAPGEPRHKLEVHQKGTFLPKSASELGLFDAMNA